MLANLRGSIELPLGNYTVLDKVAIQAECIVSAIEAVGITDGDGYEIEEVPSRIQVTLRATDGFRLRDGMYDPRTRERELETQIVKLTNEKRKLVGQVKAAQQKNPDSTNVPVLVQQMAALQAEYDGLSTRHQQLINGGH